MLLVDDHDLLAEPMAVALRLQGLHTEIAPLDSPAHVVEAAVQHRADLVLLDLDLGEQIGDGAALVPSLTATGSRVLVVTGSTDPVAAGRALEGGAIGVVHKHQAFDRLLSTIVLAAHGGSVMDLPERRALLDAARSARQRSVATAARFSRLSTSEAEVLRLLADGRGVGDIAEARVVSEATVRTQVRAILTKLDVSSQLAAVALARRSGWLDL